MEWLLIAAVLVVAFLAIRSAREGRRTQSRPGHEDLDQLTAVKLATDEDITALGMELQRLDVDVAGIDLDEGARADYQRALDAYEAAKGSLASVTAAEQLRDVASILGEGRYAIACVRARVAGSALPPRRPPCFFDPQHGLSVRDVRWAPDGGAPRDVPACALDVERVEAGADPDARKVLLGTRRVPYWQAGPSFGPWTAGYFGSFGAINALFVGTMMGGILAGGFEFGSSGDAMYGDPVDGRDDSSGSDGSDGADGDGTGSDSGGYDGADGSDTTDSGDFGGFDAGGFDGGGFDGGGFDGGF
jgi:hypothetical protein